MNYLVGDFTHLEKYELSMGFGWPPIYEMENKTCSKPPTSDVSEAGVCVYTCYWYKGYVCWLHDNSALFSWDMLGVVDEIPCEELVFAARFVQQRITPTICLENSSFVIYSNNIWLLYGYYMVIILGRHSFVSQLYRFLLGICIL